MNTKETQQVMGNKKSKQLKPVPPITIGPFSPRVAKILLEADKEYQKKKMKSSYYTVTTTFGDIKFQYVLIK
jgi:hypothetical protein